MQPVIRPAAEVGVSADVGVRLAVNNRVVLVDKHSFFSSDLFVITGSIVGVFGLVWT